MNKEYLPLPISIFTMGGTLLMKNGTALFALQAFFKLFDNEENFTNRLPFFITILGVVAVSVSYANIMTRGIPVYYFFKKKILDKDDEQQNTNTSYISSLKQGALFGFTFISGIGFIFALSYVGVKTLFGKQNTHSFWLILAYTFLTDFTVYNLFLLKKVIENVLHLSVDLGFGKGDKQNKQGYSRIKVMAATIVTTILGLTSNSSEARVRIMFKNTCSKTGD